MKKHTQIGLMVFVTIILLLALTIPSLAEKPDEPSCNISVVTINKLDKLGTTYSLEGELQAGWNDGVLSNYCTGKIPWGDTIRDGTRFASFDDWCAYYQDKDPCQEGVFYLTTVDFKRPLFVYDPVMEETMFSSFGYIEVLENGDVTLYKEYVP